MNLFVQGMRRSGTTILYDALLEDPELRLFYEPLREEKATAGGGSGARDTDAFAETREIRARVRGASASPTSRSTEFNWGGPREPRLETVARRCPSTAASFLAHLLDAGAPAVTIKETRFYDQVARTSRALDPEARRSPT